MMNSIARSAFFCGALLCLALFWPGAACVPAVPGCSNDGGICPDADKPPVTQPPQKVPGALLDSCSVDKLCPKKGYFCRGTTCLPEGSQSAPFCDAFRAALNPPGSRCQFQIRCFYDDSRRCTGEDAKTFDALIACLRKSACNFNEQRKCLSTPGTKGTEKRSGCYYRLEFTDTTRYIDHVGGVVPCESRVSKGSKGAVPVRVLLGDDRGKPMDVASLTKPPMSLALRHFSVLKVEVLDPISGASVSGATAEITLDPSHFKAFPQPVAQQLRSLHQGRSTRAVQLLIDMSEKSADRDSRLARTSAPAGWILESFQHDASILDLFGLFLVRGPVHKAEDNHFLTHAKQHLGDDQKKRGFLPTSTALVEEISSALTNISNSKTTGGSPLYDSISAAALHLNATKMLKGKLQYNPMIIASSFSPDVSQRQPPIPGAKKHELGALSKQLAGSGKLDMIPLMALVAPPESTAAIKDWDAHHQALCTLARAASYGTAYWGQVIPLLPSPHGSYQSSIRQGLDLASFASEGFLELKMGYTLRGVTPGTRVLIAVTLQAKESGFTSIDHTPILFEVTP